MEIKDTNIPMFQTKYHRRFHLFHDLMHERVNEILLVSSLYDLFSLEEEGFLGEQIFSRFQSWNLSTPPRITRVFSGNEALVALKEKQFDLIITMRRVGEMNPFEFGQSVKRIAPQCPVVLLLTNPADFTSLTYVANYDGIDHVFLWNGNSEIFLVIIKLIEDQLNVKHDTELAGVRVIIIIEDSIHYYSLFLPLIYKEIVQQTQRLIEEDNNIYHRLLRMRVRPKILLAKNYETGMQLFHAYKEYVLGIISDVRYHRDGKEDSQAGFRLIEAVRQQDPYTPILLMSNEKGNQTLSNQMQVPFLYKSAPDLLYQLRHYIKENMGFGDFIFRLPNRQIVGRAPNLTEFEEAIRNVPAESIEFHAKANSFSNWLMARGEYELATELRPYKVNQFDSIETIRSLLLNYLGRLKVEHSNGWVSNFSCYIFDEKIPFSRIGSGSFGGKGRGLAFLNLLLDDHPIIQKYLLNRNPIKIGIPTTVIINTEFFDRFIEENDLHPVIMDNLPDNQLKDIFLQKPLPTSLIDDLRCILAQVTYPLAVRSSSLLEDSQFQPFAGIYDTFMIPNNHPDIEDRLQDLMDAIRLVYASTFYSAAKCYTMGIGLKYETEKMAVVIQKVVGNTYENRFYPNVSGVAQSHNFYPVSHMKPEDGIVHLALGLGYIITDGGRSLRYCPKYPNILPQLSTPEDALHTTQNEFLALNLAHRDGLTQGEESETINVYPLKVAEEDGTLNIIGSTYDIDNDRIIDSLSIKGPRVITFSQILKQQNIPLNDLFQDIAAIGKQSFGCPVEFEFAMCFYTNKPHEFYILQMRPLLSESDREDVEVESYRDQSVIFSTQCLGNGIIRTIEDIVFVHPTHFNKIRTLEIQTEVSYFNSKLAAQNRHYALIGPGRWGTRDPFLGIPVRWNDIHFAKVIVETGLEDFQIDSSQGMHFFTNVTSTGVGYLTVPFNRPSNYIHWEWLIDQPYEEQKHYVRHIRFPKPIEIRLNGKIGLGAVLATEI